MPNSTRILLPIITVQPTFQTVISEVNSGIIPFDTFWVSCYKQSEPSIHAKIHVELDETRRDVVNLVPKDGDVQIQQANNHEAYTIACPPLDIPPTKVVLPQQEYADPERSDPRKPQRITAFDITPDGTQFATGFHDGSVHIYPVSTHPDRSVIAQKSSKPHLSSVTSLQFFPSSRVLLSAGADFSLAILPADPPPLPLPEDATVYTARVTPVRILRGHTRSITSTAIVARGRNVLSGSNDGTVRLWDVSGGQQLRVISSGNSKFTPVSSMSLGERGQGVAGRVRPNGEEITDGGPNLEGSKEKEGMVPIDEREVDTVDKVVFCALSDGSFEALDLGSKHPIFQSKTADHTEGLSSITYSPAHNMLATGSVKGTITVFDTRSLTTPLTSFFRNTAYIEDLAFACNFKSLTSPEGAQGGDGEVGLAAAVQDGLPFIASVQPEGPGVLAELAGLDCDGVRAIRVGGAGDIWIAADDGIVRRY